MRHMKGGRTLKKQKSDVVIKPSFGKQMKQYGNLFLF